MLRFAKDVLRLLPGEDVVYDPPVDEVFGVKDGQPGRGVKARGGHIEILANAHSVGVGVVGMDDRVFVCAVAVIGDPDL